MRLESVHGETPMETSPMRSLHWAFSRMSSRVSSSGKDTAVPISCALVSSLIRECGRGRVVSRQVRLRRASATCIPCLRRSSLQIRTLLRIPDTKNLFLKEAPPVFAGGVFVLMVLLFLVRLCCIGADTSFASGSRGGAGAKIPVDGAGAFCFEGAALE